MPEKSPAFTVTDRRKFTLEGDLREGESAPETAAAEAASIPPPAPASQAPEPPPAPPAPAAAETGSGETTQEADFPPEPSAEESARQHQAYQTSSRQLDDLLRQSAPGAPAEGPMNFDRLVQSIYMTAALQMGAGTAPNEQPRIDILGARQSIDMLSVLDEKTRGNLTENEKRLLQNALFDLRMSFLEITNAIASSAHKPGPEKKR